MLTAFEALPESHKEALSLAVTSLTDMFFDDYTELATAFEIAVLETIEEQYEGGEVSEAFRLPKASTGIEDTEIIDYLPQLFINEYDPSFVKRFIFTLITVATKMQIKYTELTSVAELLAMDALIEEATAILSSEEVDVDFEEFITFVYDDDVDFARLFDPTKDGAAIDEKLERTGINYLNFSEWFMPFAGKHGGYYA